MDSDAYSGFMALHSHPIIEMFSQMMNIPKIIALDMFYNSNFYRLYEQENTKLWHLSNVTLADLLRQEVMTGHIEFPVEG
jgi:hypothetical protein